VAGAGSGRRVRHDDQVHDGVPARGQRWRRSSKQTRLAPQQVVVVRRGRCGSDFPSQFRLAGLAGFHNAGFSEVHPFPRRQAGPRGWLPAHAVLGDDESCHSANSEETARLDVVDQSAAITTPQRDVSAWLRRHA
jgi:hypothetical protein